MSWFCVAIAAPLCETDVCRDRISPCRDRVGSFGVATQSFGVTTGPGWLGGVVTELPPTIRNCAHDVRTLAA